MMMMRGVSSRLINYSMEQNTSLLTSSTVKGRVTRYSLINILEVPGKEGVLRTRKKLHEDKDDETPIDHRETK